MVHTVYIYNNRKKLVQCGKIWCEYYHISSHGSYMSLVATSCNIDLHIHGSYIIVI